MAYRILSLDGGGVWSLIQVIALAKIYGGEKTGHEILQDFDLVAANSGGSFVLGGLVENLPLSKLFFKHFQNENERKKIFAPNKSLFYRILRGISRIGPKHSTKAKLEAIKNLLPDRGNLRLDLAAEGIQRNKCSKEIHLLIIGFDYDRNRAAFFRSAPVGRPRDSGRPENQEQEAAAWGTGEAADITLAQAIHASSNAPVNYFDLPAELPKQDQHQRYWDGGITGCNNPVVAAVTEALCLDQEPTNIAALSIGTGTLALLYPDQGQAPPFYQTLIKRHLRADQQLHTDVLKLATSILDDPPDIASFLAHVMTGGGKGVPGPADSRIVRLSPLISPTQQSSNDKWVAPGGWNAESFAYLADLDIDAVKEKQVYAITQYAYLWVGDHAPNQPIRMNGDTLKSELGFEKFSDAVAAWEKIK
jgi:uncharacterized protein